jgi:hypothetical protein
MAKPIKLSIACGVLPIGDQGKRRLHTGGSLVLVREEHHPFAQHPSEWMYAFKRPTLKPILETRHASIPGWYSYLLVRGDPGAPENAKWRMGFLVLAKA